MSWFVLSLLCQLLPDMHCNPFREGITRIDLDGIVVGVSETDDLLDKLLDSNP